MATAPTPGAGRRAEVAKRILRISDGKRTLDLQWANLGPREDRQEGPHAHFAGYAPGGRHVLVADLGTDELRRYLVLEDGLLEPDGIGATLPPGSGPRHFAVRGENIYLVCELDHQLRTGVIRYPSTNAAINGLILYQILSGKDHPLTSAIAYMHPTQQDVIHDFALEVARRGLTLMGSFLRRVAERVATGQPEPHPDTIVRLQADQILHWAQRWQRGDQTVWTEIDPRERGH